MGDPGELRRFFRDARQGLEHQGARRATVEIPDGWEADYLIGRLVLAGLATWKDLRDGAYDWADIWQMHDFLNMRDWLDWQHHIAAEDARKG